MSRQRKGAAAILASLAMCSMSVIAPASLADPAFGPGNNGGGEGNSSPQTGKCHPPGQTTLTPGCK